MYNKILKILLAFIVIFPLVIARILNPHIVFGFIVNEKHLTNGYEINTVRVDNEDESLPTIHNNDSTISPSKQKKQEVGVKSTKKEKKFFNTFKKSISDGVSSAFNKVKKGISNLVTGITSAVKKAANSVKYFITTVGEEATFRWYQDIYYESIDVTEFDKYWQLNIALDEVYEKEKRIFAKDEYIEQEFNIAIDNSETKNWTETEYDWLGETFDDLPETFFKNYGSSEKPTFVREEANKDDARVCAGANSTKFMIIIYDRAMDCLGGRKVSPYMLDKRGKVIKTHPYYTESSFKQTLVHELGHSFNNSQSRNYSKINEMRINTDSWSKQQLEFTLISWSKKTDVVEVSEFDPKTGKLLDIDSALFWNHKKNDHRFVSSYANHGYLVGSVIKRSVPNSMLKFWTIDAKTGKKIKQVVVGLPWEDFAESVGFYYSFPDQLKKIAPKKYDYLKNNMFNSIEYKGVIE